MNTKRLLASILSLIGVFAPFLMFVAKYGFSNQQTTNLTDTNAIVALAGSIAFCSIFVTFGNVVGGVGDLTKAELIDKTLSGFVASVKGKSARDTSSEKKLDPLTNRV